jgi:hypothetical protein
MVLRSGWAHLAMSRHAYVTVSKWPYHQLTDNGKLVSCCMGCTEDHVGIFIPCCTPDEVAAHSEREVSHASAMGAKHVCFDYLSDRYPRFQSYSNQRYYTPEAEVWLYPIEGVDASEVHRVCLNVARLRPYNKEFYRCNAVCWCVPCNACPSNTSAVGQSTCTALTLRIIAAAKYGTHLDDDGAVFKALGIDRFGCSHPFSPATLTGFAPRGTLEALQGASVVGRRVDGFLNAIRLCDPTVAATTTRGEVELAAPIPMLRLPL